MVRGGIKETTIVPDAGKIHPHTELIEKKTKRRENKIVKTK